MGINQKKKVGLKVKNDGGGSVVQARHFTNVNFMNGKAKGSNLTRSVNGSTVELHIAGNGDKVVNVTIAWGADESDVRTQSVKIL